MFRNSFQLKYKIGIFSKIKKLQRIDPFYLSVILMSVLLVGLNVWAAWNPTFVVLPEQCSIEEKPRHAPCLIDLTTGSVGEMQIYYPDEQHPGELSPNQPSGIFQFGFCGKDTLMAVTPGAGWARITVGGVSKKPKLYTAYHYLCETDREAIYALMKTRRVRWILADLYHVGAPVYYILEPGTWDIRDYHLEVTESEDIEDEFVIEMTSDLFSEPRKAL